MKYMKALLSVLLITVAVQLARAADIITLTGDNSYTVGTNEVAEVITVGNSGAGSGTFRLNNSTVFSTKSGSDGGIVSLLPMVIAGPLNTISPAATGTNILNGNLIESFVTLHIRSKAEFLDGPSPSFASSTSVVIPEDSAGPVNIVMESSTDLVNWTAANPGTYGSSTARRFFRVRAINN